MLPCVRLSFRQPVRALSTAPSNNPKIILDEALRSIGVPLEKVASPAHVASRSSTVEIPPAEDPLLHYLTSNIMRNGRRAKASRVTSNTLLYIHTLTRAPPLPIFRKAIELVSPAVRMVNNKTGAKSIPTPLPLSEKQRTRYAIQWILQASNAKPGRTLEERLARELIAVVKGQSSALEEKMRLHRTAMVNRGNIKATHM
ncbi:hypothetical protein AX17_001953 [Amanita inopinata Kibby_2008]|nr:hypothetical protein AX17_001953 [Amanita inopinata Kibby_2008]